MNAVDEFLSWSERDKRRSRHTLARYRAVLGKLAETCDPIDATVEQVEAWWATRYDGAPASRANELACLRSFYRWAVRFDHRPDDPTRRLDPPKVPHRVPRPIGKTDLLRLLGDLTEDTPDLRRAIALCVYAGLRVDEAAQLSWADIDLDGRRVYVTGKGSKQRVVALSPVLLDLLLPVTTGNVVNAGAKPYDGKVLSRKINRLLERNGIDHTVHDFRKRAATLAIAHTKNPVAVAQVFGWASIETAASYAFVGDDVLDEIAAAMV